MDKEFKKSPRGKCQNIIFKEYKERKRNDDPSYKRVTNEVLALWWHYEKKTVDTWSKGNVRFTHYDLMADVFPDIPEGGFRDENEFNSYLYRLDHPASALLWEPEELIEGSDGWKAQRNIISVYKERWLLKYNHTALSVVELAAYWTAKIKDGSGKSITQTDIYDWSVGRIKFTHYFLMHDVFPGISEREFRNEAQFIAYLYRIDGDGIFTNNPFIRNSDIIKEPNDKDKNRPDS